MFNKKSLGIQHLNRKHFSLDKFPHFAFRVKYSSGGGGVWIPVKDQLLKAPVLCFKMCGCAVFYVYCSQERKSPGCVDGAFTYSFCLDGSVHVQKGARGL